MRAATGLTRKQIDQLSRAREAFGRLRRGIPPIECAARCGFADQAHLTRSLRAFHGQTPAQVLIIITSNADELVQFVVEVFDGAERAEARTVDDYVDDIESVIERALAGGARLITKPTDFFGTRFARIQDSSANIWWIWQHGEMVWEEPSGQTGWTTEERSDGWGEVSPELAYNHDTLLAYIHDTLLAYIHDTLLDAMTALRDPKAGEAHSRCSALGC